MFEGELAENTTLITDKHPSYQKFTRGNDKLIHKSVLPKDHVDKQNKNIHLQHVNNTHTQLRTSLRPFNEVSSKYLQNYLNWFTYKDKMSGTTSTIKQWFIAILTAPLAYQLFQQSKKMLLILELSLFSLPLVSNLPMKIHPTSQVLKSVLLALIHDQLEYPSRSRLGKITADTGFFNRK